MKNVCVIGAGLGGLAAAIRLAKEGCKVDVFEKNTNPGGKANNLELNGFRFDTGPSLLTMPFVIKELFEYAGRNIDDYLLFKKLEILCKYYFKDGTVINAFSNVEKLASEISSKTNVAPEIVHEYLNYSKTIYDLTAELFLFNSFTELSTFINSKALTTLLNVRKIDPFRTMHEANESFFSDERLLQLFDRYATYNGSNPYTAPATLNIIQHVEYNLGGYIPSNGIYSIPEALYKLALEMGVKFNFGIEVKKILVNEYGVSGIKYSSNDQNELTEHFDIVVSNADINMTYKHLLDDTESKPAKKYSSLEPSTSALVFYWGIDGIFPDLEIHNILFSENYKLEFDQLFGEKVCPNDPTVYIYISSKFNSSDAPAGKGNWFVMINAPYIDGQSWDKEIKRSRKNIIDKINKTLGINIESKIECEHILSPVNIQNTTGSFRGSLYGISSNNKFAAFLRQQNRSKQYKGLYFVGGSAHPGGGIPLVILSGKIAVDLIKKYELN